MSTESSFRGKRVVSNSGQTSEVIERISAAPFIKTNTQPTATERSSFVPPASRNPPLRISLKSSSDASNDGSGAASDNPRYASVPRSQTSTSVSQTRQTTVASSSVASASQVAVTNRVVTSSPESVRPKSAIERAIEANAAQRSKVNETQTRTLDDVSGRVPSNRFVPTINDLLPRPAEANASAAGNFHSKIQSKLWNQKKFIGLWICCCCCLMWLVIGLIIWATA